MRKKTDVCEADCLEMPGSSVIQQTSTSNGSDVSQFINLLIFENVYSMPFPPISRKTFREHQEIRCVYTEKYNKAT
jgi:hypothetical protein